VTARTIALIGPMGAGKTSVGRRLAKHLDRRFVDTDAVIVAEHGAIAHLFSTVGEGAFRGIERDVVQRELRTGGVVALGGGAVLDPTTRAALADCTVVLLTVSEQAVEERIAGGKRPLLTASPPGVASPASAHRSTGSSPMSRSTPPAGR
jgi:shikimate kinase